MGAGIHCDGDDGGDGVAGSGLWEEEGCGIEWWGWLVSGLVSGRKVLL